jgi:hypothetical protein
LGNIMIADRFAILVAKTGLVQDNLFRGVVFTKILHLPRKVVDKMPLTGKMPPRWCGTGDISGTIAV